MNQPADYHTNLGREIAKLRDKGVLIVGSGNLVHNLEQVCWEKNAQPYDWAIVFDNWIKQKLQNGDFNSLTKDFDKTRAGQLSVPTLDHYLPLNYILGAANKSDILNFEHEELQNGSISMRSFSLVRF